MTIARLNGEVIAESSETVVVDGHHYFPRKSVRSGYFRPIRTDQDGNHYSVRVHGTSTECACSAGHVPDPRVTDHILFETPVIIEETG